MEQNFCVVYQGKGWLIKPTAGEDGAHTQPRRGNMDAQWELGFHVDALLILPFIHSGLNMEVPETQYQAA